MSVKFDFQAWKQIPHTLFIKWDEQDLHTKATLGWETLGEEVQDLLIVTNYLLKVADANFNTKCAKCPEISGLTQSKGIPKLCSKGHSVRAEV